MGPPGTGGPHRHARRTRRGRPPAPAGEVPARQGRRLRRQLRDRRDRHAGRRRVRGQRSDVPDPARDADLGRRHREDPADLAGPGGLPADPPPLLDRRAHEPVHLHLDRHHRRGRSPGLPPGPPRQRPHRHPRRRGRPPGPALHPMLGVPQRLPGVRAGGRPRLRLRLPGADRRHPESPTPGHPERDRRLTPVRLLAVRGLLRGVPGRHRHPRGAGASAGAGRRGRPGHPGGQQGGVAAGEGTRRRAGGHAGGALGVQSPRRPAHRPAARLPHPPAAPRSLPGPGRAWSATRDLPPVPAEPFRDWWQRTNGGKDGAK